MSSASKKTRDHILKDIRQLKVNEDGYVNLQGHFLQNIPRLIRFMNPETDVIDYEESLERVDFLGSYTLNNNRGILALYPNNIRQFFWSLVRECNRCLRPLNKNELEILAQLVVIKIYTHEFFHFACDVLRKIHGSKFDANKEEPLAVVYSCHTLVLLYNNKNTKLSSLDPAVFNKTMHLAYKYGSTGYKDWERFYDANRFSEALTDYVQPRNIEWMKNVGSPKKVPLLNFTFPMIKAISGGYDERLVY